MLTRIDCAKLCGSSVQDIDPIWTDRIDEERASGTLTSFGHASDWGADALRHRITATVRMGIDPGLHDHAQRNLDALRVFMADQRRLSDAKRQAA